MRSPPKRAPVVRPLTWIASQLLLPEAQLGTLPEAPRNLVWCCLQYINTLNMALQELPSAMRQLATRHTRPVAKCLSPISRRCASGEAAPVQNQEVVVPEDFQDLEAESSFNTKYPRSDTIKSYDPVKRSQSRRGQLPPSRYVIVSIEYKQGNWLTLTPDINSDPQDTTEDLYIPISLLLPPILHLASSYPVPSHTLVSNKHGNLPLLPIS